MNQIPREKLREIIAKNGDVILNDPGRCEGLLRDHCGPHRREISALVGAMQERVPVELKGSWQTAMTPEAMRARMVQRLEEHRGLAPEVADWAVDAWSYALGVDLGRKSDPVSKSLIGDGAGTNGAGGAGVVMAGDEILNDKGSPHQDPLHGDRPGGGSGQGKESGKGKPAFLAALDPKKNKTGLGVVLALLLVIGGYAYFRHPVPSAPCANGSTEAGCKVNPGPGPGPGPENGPDAGAAAINAVAQAKVPVLVQLSQSIDSEHAVAGQQIPATVTSAVMVNGQEIIPQGSAAIVRVTHADNAGHFKGVPELSVSLVQVTIQGAPVDVRSSYFSVRGKSRGKNTAVKTGIGAGVGALIGGILGKGKGAAIGAGTGAGTAMGYQGLTHAQPAVIQAESVLSFRLKAVPGATQPPATASNNGGDGKK
jgi:hypothetical protein